MVSDDVLYALARLADNPDWQTFLKELERLHGEAVETLQTVNETWMLARAQGAAQTLSEIQSLAAKARKALQARHR